MNPALLLVDLQNDFLDAPELQPAAEFLIRQTEALLNGCRRRQIPVLHAWTTVSRDPDRRLPHWRQTDRWKCLAGTDGHKTPDSLRPLPHETIIHKTGFNAFADGALAVALNQLKCDHVIIAGLHLHACVRTAATECLERNLQVQIADDAVASNDPIHAAATWRWLAERCVGIEPVNAILARLDGGADSLIHRSPRTSAEILFEVPVAGQNEIAGAAAAAHLAWIQWRELPWPDRQQRLEKTAGLLEAAAVDLARQMAIDIGKPVTHGIEEVRRAASNILDVIRCASARREKRGTSSIIRDQPLGVTAIISPWNNPVAIPLGKIAPALAYGNTVVWKPAPAATRISRLVLKLLHEAGVPPEAVHLLTGDHRTAQQLAADENIDALSFTGSLAGGRVMQEICGRRFIPLQAELSGNNAAIVWEDVDFSEAAAQVAWGAFAFAGQRCTANRRVIVQESHFEILFEKLKAAGEHLAWGDPLAPETEIGPVISLARRDELAAMIAAARNRSRVPAVALLHEAHARQPWASAGAYAQPAIICCDDPRDALVQEETMAPLLVVQRAKDFDHALTLCNGVRHGLAASLFTRSPERQQKFLQEIRAGVIKFNAATAGVDVTLPFGGWKASGIGPPEHGEGDRLFYSRLQAVYGMEEPA